MGKARGSTHQVHDEIWVVVPTAVILVVTFMLLLKVKKLSEPLLILAAGTVGFGLKQLLAP